MKWFLTNATILILCGIMMYLSCIKETHFNPTGDIGVTIEAFVCDTTDLDTTITIIKTIPMPVQY